MKKHLDELKKRIDSAVAMINDPLFGANYKVVSECKQEIVLAQVEINRALFAYKKHAWRSPEDLPDTEGNVIVSLNGKHGNVTYDHAIDFVYYIPGYGFYDEPEKDKLVEAWMRPMVYIASER